MTDRNTQSRLEIFKAALGNNKLDWPTYLQLEDQQADAIQAMINRDILTTEKSGHYEVKINIRGINPSARSFAYGPDRIPLYFREEADSKTLIDFCANKGGTTSEHHD